MGMLMSRSPSRDRGDVSGKWVTKRGWGTHAVRNSLTVKFQKTLKPVMRMRIALHVTPHMARPG